MKIIEVNVNFPCYCENPWEILLTAIKEKVPDIEILKLRYTYFESNYGVCDFPPGLMLAQFMDRCGPLEGFNSHINKCSGTYKLNLNNNEDS